MGLKITFKHFNSVLALLLLPGHSVVLKQGILCNVDLLSAQFFILLSYVNLHFKGTQ